MKGNFNYNMCKSCGGKCCTKFSGSYIPSDFKEPITVDFIINLLLSGKYAIDDWIGDAKELNKYANTYYIRPRHVDEAAVIGSRGGICVNWTKDNGCSLSEEDRPFQCRMLEPILEDGEHVCSIPKEAKSSKQDCAATWYDYQNLIERAMEKYQMINNG